MNKVQTTCAGFTLIETLVYLGLFAIIMVGIVATAYGVFESNGRSQTKTMVQNEGDFMLAKINWALTGATAISVVNSPLSLTITRASNPTSVVFDQSGNYLEINRNGAGGVNLNNSNVQIQNLSFINAGHGTPTESVAVSFNLLANTPNGTQYSQNFQTTKYLRK